MSASWLLDTSTDLKHPEQIRVTRIHGYYDGPLSFEAEYDGRRVWGECVDDHPWHRRYAIFDLTDDECDWLDEQNALFERWVGDGWRVTYDNGRMRRVGWTVRQPRELHRNYYDQAVERDLTALKAPVGFMQFTYSPHGRRLRSRRYILRNGGPK